MLPLLVTPEKPPEISGIRERNEVGCVDVANAYAGRDCDRAVVKVRSRSHRSLHLSIPRYRKLSAQGFGRCRELCRETCLDY